MRGVKKTPPSSTPPVGSERFARLSFGSGRGDGSGAGTGGATASGANNDATASGASRAELLQLGA